MSVSPGEVAEGIGWAPIISVATAIALALLGYGASTQKNRQTADDLDKLEKEHAEKIKEAKSAADQVAKDLNAYEKQARDRFVLTDDLRRVESSLSAQIRDSQAETVRKVESSHTETTRKIEDLRVEFGKKGIEHTVNTAITKGMAQVVQELRKRDDR